jgi:hypothetical protein
VRDLLISKDLADVFHNGDGTLKVPIQRLPHATFSIHVSFDSGAHQQIRYKGTIASRKIMLDGKHEALPSLDGGVVAPTRHKMVGDVALV